MLAFIFLLSTYILPSNVILLLLNTTDVLNLDNLFLLDLRFSGIFFNSCYHSRCCFLVNREIFQIVILLILISYPILSHPIVLYSILSCVCALRTLQVVFSTHQFHPQLPSYSPTRSHSWHTYYLQMYICTHTHVSYGYLSLFRFTQLRDGFFPLLFSSLFSASLHIM